MKRPWTQDELSTLRREYPHQPTASIAASLGRSSSSVYNAAFNLGLMKTAEYLASDHSGRVTKLTAGGNRHRFLKGHATWNKGMRGLDIGGKETRFPAGNMPHNHRPVGSERTDRDGILWRKVSDTRNKKADWRAVHVTRWEEVNGPLPADKIVVFADGNRSNFDPSNLLALTRPELMKRNTVHRYPKEIARLIQLRGALNRQINKRGRDAKQD